ncbi:MAG: AAA family ATPase [Lachnospiraceae bacterium]
MLLEFKTKNYKSFVEEASFSMVVAPKQKGLDYSLMKTKIKGKEIKGLSSSVIYGPNAAGKTNIIGAMDVLRAIVLRGNIRNSEEKSSPNPVSSRALELIPNNNEMESKPVCFEIEFYEEDGEDHKFKIHYELEVDLGTFLEEEHQRKILAEVLEVNGERVFERAEDLKIENLKVIKDYLSDITEQNADSVNEIAKNSLNQEELFLTNGFKLIFSPKFTKLIVDWFTNKFMVIYRADSMQLIKRFADPKKKAIYVEKTTDEVAKLFGINSNAVGYVVSDDEPDAKLYSVFKNMKNKKTTAVASRYF